jgi:tRNA threonylcarbamoyladenosine biosynthesis protein TsaB
MKILAFDTATEACSAALWLDGEIVERYEVAGREHTQRLALQVSALMTDAGLNFKQLDGIACGIGPGSFAGVRIGVGYAKGLALALDVPVVGVSSLAMLALRALRESNSEQALAVVDARMNEVYFGAYQRSASGLVEKVATEIVCAPDAVPTFEGVEVIAAGSGWAAYRERLSQATQAQILRILPDALPHAEDALRLAVPKFEARQGINADDLTPAYLRDKVALTLLEQLALRKS